MNNYRPISVLPLLSKLLEKHVYHALYSYLRENNILYDFQSGFRERYSTETAYNSNHRPIAYKYIDKNNVSGLIFIDYKKAFDLINHDILLSKLKTYGIKSKELAFFASYLNDRTQVVNIEGQISTSKTITHGEPQGSVLGPLLFIVFINHLPKVVTRSVVDIYADDTTVTATAHWESASTVIQRPLQEDIDQVTKWTIANKMILNSSKTKTMLVTGVRLANKFSQPELNILVHKNKVEEVNVHKLLGVYIDKELNFTEHVNVMCKKLAQRIGVLKKIKRHLPLEERKLYYNALIKPVMMYGCTIWSSCSNENVERVYKLQKRAARVILDAITMERSVNLSRKLNWLPLYDEIKIQKCSVIFRRIVGESPGYVEKLLTRNVDLGNRFNRHSHINLVCPKYQRESEGGRTFMVTGTRLSNSIPVEVKKKNSLGSFKYALRKYFLDYMN